MEHLSTPSSTFFTRLPVELLRDLFLSAAFSKYPHEEGYSDYTSQQIATSLAISQVCTYWRSVALGTGLLWARIHFPEHRSNSRFSDLLLERSKQCLIDVFVRGSFGRSSDRVAECLAPFGVDRLESFTLDNIDQDYKLSEALQWLFAANTPIPLQSLVISRWSRIPAPLLYATLGRLFERAPNLKRIGLYGMRYPWENPLVGLLSLKLMARLHENILPTPEQMETALRSCPRLQTLEIKCSSTGSETDPYSYPSVTSPSIRLDFLQTLSLESMHPQRLAHILSLISTPVLRVVKISPNKRSWGMSHAEGAEHILTTFVFRQAKEQPNQKSTIEMLLTQDVQVPQKQMAALFDTLEELETLSVKRCSSVVDILTPSLSESEPSPATRTPRCPKLQRLELCEATVKSLEELVRARLASSAIGLTKPIILLCVDKIEEEAGSDRSWLMENVELFSW